MKLPTPSQGLAAGATAVTVLLTAAAFWLSYEHLHDVADGNGLNGARAWAWPATVDLFIVAGELLMLRASLRGRIDGWAIALAATGSFGSIALNVAGVGINAEPLEYVVAAVPPTAALIAFGALMRQVHTALASRPEPAPVTMTIPVTWTPPRRPPVVPAGVHTLPVIARPQKRSPTSTEVVPAGVRTLPLVATEVTTTVTIDRVTPEPAKVVTRPAIETGGKPLAWPAGAALGDQLPASLVTTAVPSADPRNVVTVPVTVTPAELRKQARALNRQVVRETNRPVTTARLQEEYGLSRRDATELRRAVVDRRRS
ncbi:DUF2637 domain-containing protein [Streptomyces sp. B1I3]|uniref:DUF2637 domain-containing protein n=1 Tax=Streptomyces sp. B1I3 TaxID=3042264 RepID=UPI002784B00D|nr:DUF2637 domain-containing protein [Streptomyces sp. B1I3]MDQ0795593.1 hypothetical protein [Streptomyces sp. B1I3]